MLIDDGDSKEMDINDEETNRVRPNNDSRDNSTVSGVPHESGNETVTDPI